MMKYYVSLLIAALMVSGCASEKHPTRKYAHASKAQKPHGVPFRNQPTYECPSRLEAKPFVVAVEGETVESDIYVVSANAAAERAIQTHGAPIGLTITSAGMEGDRHRFILRYTPPPNLIAFNMNYAEFEMELWPASQTTQRCSLRMGVVVTRTGDNPIIEKVTAPSEITLTQGAGRSISVEVKAPGLASEDNLLIFAKPDHVINSTKEKSHYDLTPALVYPTRATRTANNTYLFVFDIDEKVLAALLENKPRQDEYVMVTQLKAFNSQNKLDSPAKNIEIIVKRPAREGAE